MTADIITSTDPQGTVKDLADDLGKIDGVAAITKQTPNETGDLGLVRVVPEWSQSDPRTTDLVQRIRDRAPQLEKDLKIADITVTGQTAVAIDVSSQLSGALVPFGIVVVGLALILLAIVFRSVAVPIKATLGYLLSIAAALGAVSATFVWGWLAGPLDISLIGPVVSFLPIILMGVLFGLAMDYEVFLVSQMREDYVHGHGAQHAVRTGFISSARVVTAAAIIMISVFAAFIPEGNSTIKPIALGLAVGVFVDAFLVRMTLVPAVMALLGNAAWWMPRWLDRRLPEIDIEGQALVRHVAQAEWDAANGPVAVRAEAVALPSSAGPVEVNEIIPRGVVATFEHPDPQFRSALTWTLSGRHRPDGGELAVLGHVLPEEAGYVRKKVRVLTAPSAAEDALTVRRYLSTTFVAHSERIWQSRRLGRQALAQAEAWISELGPAAGDTAPLRRRQLVNLSTLERRLVALSAVATEGADVIVVEEADAALGPDGLARFSSVCGRLVQTSGSTVILVGAHLASSIGTGTPIHEAAPPLEPQPEGEPTIEPEPVGSRQRSDRVCIFVTGTEEWRYLPDWPPEFTEQVLYLQPDGQLGESQPSPMAGPSTFTYDPADPTPAVGGRVINPTIGGRRDNRDLEKRDDVLTFTGPPLSEPVEVIGNPVLELVHRTDNPYADVCARLCEVRTNGRSINLSDAFQWLEPERSSGTIRLQLESLAHRFNRGTRIRLQISGGAHARWARNLGTDEDPATGTRMAPSRRTICHGDGGFSRIVLPCPPE